MKKSRRNYKYIEYFVIATRSKWEMTSQLDYGDDVIRYFCCFAKFVLHSLTGWPLSWKSGKSQGKWWVVDMVRESQGIWERKRKSGKSQGILTGCLNLKVYHPSVSTWWSQFLESAISRNDGKFSEVREKSREKLGKLKVEKSDHPVWSYQVSLFSNHRYQSYTGRAFLSPPPTKIGLAGYLLLLYICEFYMGF